MSMKKKLFMYLHAITERLVSIDPSGRSKAVKKLRTISKKKIKSMQ